MPKTVVVIGAEGFLGKKVVNNLNENGYDVIGIDIQKSSSNIAYKHFIQKNISDITIDDLSFLKNIEDYGVINVGGVSRNGIAAMYPIESCHNTVNSYIHLLEQLDFLPPKWMILTSTREVDILLSDKEKLTGKQQIYPTLKLTSELISKSYQEHWQIPLGIFRLSDIFGIGDHPSKVMNIFLNKAINNEDIHVFSPDAKLFLTEVSEVSSKITDFIKELEEKRGENSLKLIQLWDEEYVFSLLELAYLALELNPSSTSKIVAPKCKKPNYKIKEKFRLKHLEVLNRINSSFNKN